jgi:MFS family permease
MFAKVFHNKVIRTIVVIEFFFAAAFGMFSPMFAIFASGSIIGGSAKVAGFAMAVFWATKAIFQLPVARYLDKTKGEKDDFYAYFIGQILFAIGMFLYVVASLPVHVYSIQVLLGIAFAINVPAFYGIFSRHLDKNYESFEWSVYSVFSYSIAVAIAGAVSGIIVDVYGFPTLFTVIGIFFVLSALLNFVLLRPRLAGHKEEPPVNLPRVTGRDYER